jgi:hypothetical protein
MRTRAGLFLLSAMVVVLAGCSPGSARTGGAGSPSGSPSSVSPTAGPTTMAVASTPSPTPPAQPQTPADLLAYIQAGSPVGVAAYGGSPVASFSTPSGNISCGVFGPSSAAVLCFVDENSWPSVTAQTCSNFGDWTDHSLTTSSSGVRRGDCFSEQPFPRPGNVLPYGSTISNGSVACRSESAFLACAHLGSGNGFVIARAILRTYGTVQSPHGN